MVKARNQKLSNEQIATILYLRQQGYPKSIIAKTVHVHCKVSLSITYYHLDKLESVERIALKQLIRDYIREGLTTRHIADMWGTPLSYVNDIYAR
jgi:hypothetical protein